MNSAQATRPIYWNISHVWAMYAMLAPAIAIGGYGVARHVQRWRRGRPLARFDRPADRLRLVIRHALAQQRTARERYAGLFHRFITYGFIILTMATILVGLDADLGTSILHGRFYLYFQSLIVDVFGALTIIGIAMAALRRYGKRPEKLVYTDEASWILAAIFIITSTGFLIEGWRIAATNDPWAAWSPFGNLVAQLSRPLMTVAAMEIAHRTTWWFHLAATLTFLAWVPYTKMMHVLTAPLNIYTANLLPIGASLKKIDFEKSETLGVSSLDAFTWKDLLDLDACTECGRCTAVCPAHAVGKELSPRDIILHLRDSETIGPAALHLWECTTCGACVETCPVFIEQMPKIVDMRRHLVMEESDFPESMQEAILSLEKRGHPFSGTQATRLDWAEGLDIRHVSEAKDAEVLLWVGCGGALIERNQKVIRAIAQLLQKAGVRFAVLGREEKCSGDPARRIGNEFLFETLAKENVANLNKYKVRKVITPCPHCFNTFKNEYPQYGGAFEVYHHSEFLAQLIDAGRLKPRAEDRGPRTAFHDPCYLGRQNEVYDAPRRVAGAPIELARNRNQSFCCGGGGGMSFIDEPADKRVNQERAREALETGAEVLAVSCPFCMTMMQDGINARKGTRDMRVMDIAEVLWAAQE
ncbi:MAG TPA: heterodisulfide reductase-related iron-sulfur binding cluster [Thermoanaerobaculia bacterium]|nr:heterodisulfide reductase-related iron-sulfur binding cluster [Thermoanaerobaculia bacterium]